MTKAPEGSASAEPKPFPDWDQYPILDGIATPADVSVLDKSYKDKKGKWIENKVDYVNWARCLRVLRQHAKGWIPGYKTWIDEHGKEHIVHEFPDGSAAVVVFFRAPTGSGFLDTEPFCQPIVNGVYPVKASQCTALKVTNAIKRVWAAAAATHFGLFSELWSKDALEDPFLNESNDHQPSAAAPPAPAQAPQTATPAATTANQPTQADELEERRSVLKTLLLEIHLGNPDATPPIKGDPTIKQKWSDGLRAAFPANAPHGISAAKPTLKNCTAIEHLEWTQNFLNSYELPKD